MSSSGKHRHARYKGGHRKPSRTKTITVYAGTTAAAGVIAAGLSASPAMASAGPQEAQPSAAPGMQIAGPRVAAAEFARIQFAAIIMEAKALLHQEHMFHVNHLLQQQKYIRQKAAEVQQPAGGPAPAVQQSSPAVTYQGSGSMQQCIIARESGGNSQIWNASGHYGLYQFSEQTWVAHGGNPADFGHASVAEQNRVYYSTVAQDGYSDWAPYDGC